jgi:hypothetical protein
MDVAGLRRATSATRWTRCPTIDQALGWTALQDRDVRAAEAATGGGDRSDRMRHRYGKAHCRLLISECLLAEGDTAAAGQCSTRRWKLSGILSPGAGRNTRLSGRGAAS